MGSHLLFLVDFIIAQNLEKVKFWEGKEGSREGRETSEIEKWVMGEREEGWRSGVSVFQFLPGTTPPVLTLTNFDFRLVKKGKGFRPSRFGYFVRILPQSLNNGQL